MSEIVRPIFLDYETRGIEGRPDYPPKPCGIAIKEAGKPGHYWAFGHLTKNNCTEIEAKRATEMAWPGHGESIAFHNGKFDLDVAQTHWKLPLPPWRHFHDTMLLLFLNDPHQKDLGLKPSATKLLKMPATERDEVKEWLLKHQPLADKGIKISSNEDHEHYWVKYIWAAPGDLVGRYAIGDVVRTEKLFNLLHPKTLKRGMGGAYDRERKLLPLLLDMERRGVPVDLKRLKKDVALYKGWFDEVNAWIIHHLKAPADINLNSGAQLVAAMIKARKVDVKALGVTPKTQKPKTDQESLMAAVSDKVLLAMLKYRAPLKTCLHTFLEPWLKTALKSNGLIFTNWNQVRGTDAGGGGVGARTGRMSSTPNFQNIPQAFDSIFHHEDPKAKLPKCPLKGLPALPKCRSYITAFPGHILLDRDYSQQEPRILAHFEGGDMLAQYQANPWIDFHDNTKAQLEQATGRIFDRKHVKIINLMLLYGGGIGLMAERAGISWDEAKLLKNSILGMYPGLKGLFQEMKLRAKENKPLRTWGGREYYCEPPIIHNGQIMTFDYKMVNVLIQGSAADCTKEATIRFYDKKKKTWYLLALVHDEALLSVPVGDLADAMRCLRDCMESVEFDVKMLTTGKFSKKSWAELKDYDKKGKVLK